MTFYLKPASGDIRLGKLENYCVSRASFLKQIVNCSSNISAINVLTQTKNCDVENNAGAEVPGDQHGLDHHDIGNADQFRHHDNCHQLQPQDRGDVDDVVSAQSLKPSVSSAMDIPQHQTKVSPSSLSDVSTPQDGAGINGTKRGREFELLNVDPEDCLIAGTANDAVSHWILRLACSSCNSTWEFFVDAETHLFQYRLSCMNQTELVVFLRTTKRHLNYVLDTHLPHQHRSTLLSLQRLLHSYSTKMLARLMYEGCTEQEIELPFEDVLPLVARRRVVISKGLACVMVSDVQSLLSHYFRCYLQLSFGSATQAVALEDSRFHKIVKAVREHILKDILGHQELGFVTADMMDQVVNQSPLCIKNIHNSLNTTHKVHHNARFKYTLFQKEAGLPVNEAISFWMKEYTLSGNWAPRYIYGIRHMYGLEGSRKNYRSHSCSEWQNAVASGDEAVCPFAHFDGENIQAIMDQNCLMVEEIEAVMQLITKSQHLEACKLFHNLTFMQQLTDKELSPTTSADIVSMFNQCKRPVDFHHKIKSAVTELPESPLKQ